jgi:hypothetical protein
VINPAPLTTMGTELPDMKICRLLRKNEIGRQDAKTPRTPKRD